MRFTKMQGAGNDYIYVNCLEETVNDPKAAAIKVSDRHFGIGADGLVLICPSEKADFFMDMYNADGSRGKMCGNAVRCVAKYVYDRGLVHRDEIAIETLSGIKTIQVRVEGGKVVAARVNMGAPVLNARDIPTAFEGETVVSQKLTIGEETHTVTCVSMGNPHCVVFVQDPNALELPKIGPAFERHPMFPDRINTEFVHVISPTHLEMRVWERGSGETLACGTGACASVVAATLNGFCRRGETVRVRLRGGELQIQWAADGDVYMTGPAAEICTGEIEV